MIQTVLSAVAGVVMGAVSLLDGSTPANKMQYDAGDVALGKLMGQGRACAYVADKVDKALDEAGVAHDIVRGTIDGIGHIRVEGPNGKVYDLAEGRFVEDRRWDGLKVDVFDVEKR